MAISNEACTAIAAACTSMVETMHRFFHVQGSQNDIDQPMLENQREDALDAVAVSVCRLGRYLRLVRGQANLDGACRKELLDVLTSFDVILHYYGWSDEPRSPCSMNNPDTWRAHWPTKWPMIPYIRPALLEALERAGRKLQEALSSQAQSTKSLANGPRLTFDEETKIVTLDGVSYGPLTPPAFRILESLHETKKDYLTAADLQGSIPGCRGNEKSMRRQIAKLPEPLKSCIKSKPGAGRWLQLPEK